MCKKIYKKKDITHFLQIEQWGTNKSHKNLSSHVDQYVGTNETHHVHQNVKLRVQQITHIKTSKWMELLAYKTSVIVN
jgi:hypothetical protein